MAQKAAILSVSQTRYFELRPFEGVRLAAAVEAAAIAVGVSVTSGYWMYSAMRRGAAGIVETRDFKSLTEVRALSSFDGEDRYFAFTRELSPGFHVNLSFRDVIVCSVSCESEAVLNAVCAAISGALEVE